MNKLMLTAAVAATTVASAYAGYVELSETVKSSIGTVTGVGKEYKANTKVTIKATAKKGYVFTKWGEGTTAELNEDPRSATVTFTTPEEFGEDDIIYIDAAESFTKEADIEDKTVVLPESYDGEITSVTFPTVSVKGLPAGMKYDAKKLAFSGEPTKDGIYTMTLSAKNTFGFMAEKVYTITKGEPIEGSVGAEFDSEELGDADTYKNISVSGLPTGIKLVKVTKDEYGDKVDPAYWALNGTFAKAGTFATTITKTYKEGDWDPEVVSRLYAVKNVSDTDAFASLAEALNPDGGLAVGDEIVCEEAAEFSVVDKETGLGTKSVSVSGLPAGIKLVRKAVEDEDDNGKKVVVAYSYTLEGMPTKIGSYSVVFTQNEIVENESGKKVAKALKQYVDVTVASAASVEIAIDDWDADEEKGQVRELAAIDESGAKSWMVSSNCTVKGAGIYTPAQKVTLTAKLGKNYYVSGWYENDEATAESYKTSFSDYSKKLANWITSGGFVEFLNGKTSDGKKENPLLSEISLVADAQGKLAEEIDSQDEEGFDADADYIALAISSYTEIKSVTLSNLPAGMKFTAKDGKYVITVANQKQLKPGDYAVKATVKTAGCAKGKVCDVTTITVKDLEDESGYVKPTNIGEDIPLYVGIEMEPVDVTAFSMDADEMPLSASGLPAGLKLVKKTDKETKTVTYTVEGTPKKSGTTTVTWSVKVGKAHTATAKVIVQDSPSITTTVYPEDAGTVTGKGTYNIGQTYTLKATAAKGYVFNGWYLDDVCVSQDATYSHKVTEAEVRAGISLDYRAVFVDADEDIARTPIAKFTGPFAGISTPWVFDGKVFRSTCTNVMGVAYCCDIEIDALSQVKITASGLPAGLKLVKDEYGDWTVEGVATKAGSYKVTYKLTNASGAVQTYVQKMEVLPLPAWVAVSYSGFANLTLTNAVKDAEESFYTTNGYLNVAVNAQGALSGTVKVGKQTIKLTAKNASKVEIVDTDCESFAVYTNKLTGAFYDLNDEGNDFYGMPQAAFEQTPEYEQLVEDGYTTHADEVVEKVAPYVNKVAYEIEQKIGKDAYAFTLEFTGSTLTSDKFTHWAKNAVLSSYAAVTVACPEAWEQDDTTGYAYYRASCNKKTGYDFTAANVAAVKKLLADNAKAIGEGDEAAIPGFKLTSVDATGLIKFSYKLTDEETGRTKTINATTQLYPNPVYDYETDAYTTVLDGSYIKISEDDYVIFLFQFTVVTDEDGKDEVTMTSPIEPEESEEE